ncbi:hypothetical protein [Cellulosimicrobium arenosum]|uniref:Uncharacterized protein n=1 Tax=Cellulosimicrobium arenosum TaxID=2708133 RepID=A0A927G898_9MICO|nr:hypothetical protein [Cellulosimicrobium arenosum]MBD8078749.1 hypothetical protein [Cellulosimicrobium arenosum]
MSTPADRPPPYGAPSPYGASSPYGPPDLAAQGQAAPGPTSRRRSPLAVTSFVAGLVTVLVGTLVTLVYPFILSASGYSPAVLSTVQIGNGFLGGIAGLVALVTGLLALSRRDAGTGLAAAGAALGGSAVLGVVVALAQGLLYRVV